MICKVSQKGYGTTLTFIVGWLILALSATTYQTGFLHHYHSTSHVLTRFASDGGQLHSPQKCKSNSIEICDICGYYEMAISPANSKSSKTRYSEKALHIHYSIPAASYQFGFINRVAIQLGILTIQFPHTLFDLKTSLLIYH